MAATTTLPKIRMSAVRLERPTPKSQRPAPSLQRPIPKFLVTFILVLIVQITIFSVNIVSSYAATTANNYRSASIEYSNNTQVQVCRGWSGDSDDAGNLYMACPVKRDINQDGVSDVDAPALFEIDTSGKVTKFGFLPSEYAFNDSYPIRDIGVSPDGTSAYISVGPNTDNLGQHPELNPTTKQPMPNGATTGTLLRLTRRNDGSWVYDPTFKAGPYLIDGNYWAVRYVDVDARGHIYISTNAIVYELDPKNGAIISSFGGGATTAYPGGPWIEGFDKPEGLAVSPDGQSILLVDQQHQIVQKWIRIGDLNWARDKTFLLGVPSQIGDFCTSTDHFQSPYDVAVDAVGDIYVMDTTCQRVQRFNKSGTFIQTVWSNLGGNDWNHGFAVNWQGSLLLPIEEKILIRLDPPAKPSPSTSNNLTNKVRMNVRIAGRGCRRIPPFRRIARVTSYRIVDRCAHILGRVKAINRTRTGWQIQIMVRSSISNKIWVNSSNGSEIKVILDRFTTIRRNIRVGRNAAIIGSISTNQDFSAAYVIPTDLIVGL